MAARLAARRMENGSPVRQMAMEGPILTREMEALREGSLSRPNE